jgi:ribosomal protein L11 methylase PrmA
VFQTKILSQSVTTYFPAFLLSSWLEQEKRRVGLSQHINLTAFDSPFFFKAIENFVLANIIFQRSIGSEVKEWMSKTMDNHHPCFLVANRYFTPKWRAPYSEDSSSTLAISIDPKQILGNFRQYYE